MESKPAAPSLESLSIFDTCLTMGRLATSQAPEPLPDAQAVLAMMDRYDIAEALVHEHHARVVHPRKKGNLRLLGEIAGHPRLHPVWVIQPPQTPGRAPARALVEEMLDAGVRAARLPMGKMPSHDWYWADLCAALEEHRVPCFLDFGDVSTLGSLSDFDVDAVGRIAAAHPALPMILSHVMGGLGIHPAIVPLMRRQRNIFIDVGALLEYWRQVARQLGAERVLFAGGAPFTDPGILISNIQYARGFSVEEKALMYGGNIRRLIEEERQ